MRFIALLTVLMVCPFIARAHDEVNGAIQTLTVAADGTVALAPDTAFVTVGMEASGKSLVEAHRLNSAVMQRVMERLRELHVEKERIQTSACAVSPQYKPPPKRPSDTPTPPEIIGCLVSSQGTVEVRNLERVTAVVEETLAAGANYFHGLCWSLWDERRARLDALKLAAAKAREKATVLSEALNVKLGRLMNVTESGQLIPPVPRVGGVMAATEAVGEGVPIGSGERRAEATVTLIYEIP
jgi:uncharacterized protein YggE